MAEPKTRPTDADVTAFLDAIPDEERRADAHDLVELMSRVTGAPPVLWGTAIVGFDSVSYRYASGRGGDWPVLGFSPRRNAMTVYLMDGFTEHAALLGELGRHSTGKSCLYVQRLSDVDTGVLEELLRRSAAATMANHARSR